MSKVESHIRIHMSDDDADDRMMMKDAMEAVRLGNNIDFSVDGQDLMAYLRREGQYESLKRHQLPGLILLDLNMPRKSGMEALREIKQDPTLHKIPVVVLTTSSTEEDVLKSYDLGVNSFITKPVSFEKLVDVIRKLTEYWFQVVRIPELQT